MEHSGVLPGPLEVLVSRMKEVRVLRGLTAQQLADAMTAEGVKWNRSAVTKLENGHRQAVTVVEWLTLSYVLNTAPLSLLLPSGESNYQVTPNSAALSEAVWRWAAGQGSLQAIGAEEVEFDQHLEYFQALPKWKQAEERPSLARLAAKPERGEFTLDDEDEGS